MNHRTAIVLICFAASAVSSPTPASQRHHGPHVHGEASLHVGIDGALLLVSLEAPGMSLLGFEHPPRDAAEHAAYATIVADVKSANWLALPTRAGCVLESTDIQSHGFGDEASSDHSGQRQAEHEHADFDAVYRYTCHAPLALREFDVRLFDAYANLHKINVELVLPGGEGSQVLTPGATTVLLGK